jgi:iron(III) transport system substrate-binding protein
LTFDTSEPNPVALTTGSSEHGAKPGQLARMLWEDTMRRNALHAACAAAFAITLTVASSSGWAFTPDHADRAAAVKEGNVNWYTSTPFPLVQILADRFTKDTGVKVTLLRTGGEAVLRRFLQEYQAGQAGADVLTMSDAGAASGLARQGVFVPFKPEGFDKVIDTAKDKDGNWIAQRVHVIGMPVRTDLVAEADRPKTWSDLKDPKYKGKMVMPDPSFTAIQLTVVGMLSQKLGWDFYKALRKNDTMIVQGHQQVFKTMQQGERVIGAEGADPTSYNQGKPLPNQTMIYPTEGVFTVCSPVAIVKNARNPNAAKLFAQFMLSETAQTIIAENAIHSSRLDIAPPKGQPSLKEIKVIPIDLDYIEKNGKKLKDRFSEIFQ